MTRPAEPLPAQLSEKVEVPRSQEVRCAAFAKKMRSPSHDHCRNATELTLDEFRGSRESSLVSNRDERHSERSPAIVGLPCEGPAQPEHRLPRQPRRQSLASKRGRTNPRR